MLSLVKDKISFTRFCKNCFHSFEPFIQQIAVLLSSHKCVLSIVICDAKASLTEDTNLAKMTPDSNSSLGIDCLVSGATLVLDDNKTGKKSPLTSRTK